MRGHITCNFIEEVHPVGWGAYFLTPLLFSCCGPSHLWLMSHRTVSCGLFARTLLLFYLFIFQFMPLLMALLNVHAPSVAEIIQSCISHLSFTSLEFRLAHTPGPSIPLLPSCPAQTLCNAPQLTLLNLLACSLLPSVTSQSPARLRPLWLCDAI